MVQSDITESLEDGGKVYINPTVQEKLTEETRRSSFNIENEEAFHDLVLENASAVEKDSGLIADSKQQKDNKAAVIEEGPLENKSKGKSTLLNRAKGIGLILLAILMATGQGAITKYLKVIPTGELIIVTGIYTMLLFSLFITYHDIPLFSFSLKKVVFTRVMFSVVVKIVKVWSFQHLPFGDATALIFTSPLFACILGRIFLKEKLTLPHVIAMILGITGIFMIAKPTFIFSGEESGPWYYNLVPILGAMSMGSAYTAQRRIGTDVNCITISMYMTIAGNLGGLGFQTISGDDYVNPRCLQHRPLMLLGGIISVAGLVALNKALQYEKAATVSLMRNLDTVLAFLLQVAVFSEPVEAFSLAGTALIMIGTLTLTLSKLFDVSCGVTI